MSKHYLTTLLTAAFVAIGGGYAQAQGTDVTETYIKNAGFEECTAATANIASKTRTDYSSNGWTANTASIDNSCSGVVSYGSSVTVNNVKAPTTDNAGNTGNALGISVGWSQTITYSTAKVTLPAGAYQFTAHVYNNNTSPRSGSDGTAFNSQLAFVPTSGTAFTSTTTSATKGQWTEDVVTFTLSEATEGTFQVGFKSDNTYSTAQAIVFIDNLTLQKYDKTEDLPGWAFNNGTYYLYDETNKMFISRGSGEQWGTHASVDKYGIPFTATLANGAYKLYSADWNSTVGLNSGLYTDNASPVDWTVTASGNGFTFANDGKYLKGASTQNAALGTTTTASDATVWTLKTVAEHDAIVKAYTTENYTDVAKAASLTDVTADNFLTTLSDNYVNATAQTIEPTSYTWKSTASKRGTASSASPREIYAGAGTFTYTVSNLAQGIYKVTIPALFRNGKPALCVENATTIPYNSTAYIIANDEQIRIKGWAEEYTETTNPNSVSQAKTAFEAGRYTNEVYCYVGSDGTLSLTVAYPSYQETSGNSNDPKSWGIFGTTTLTYYTPKSDLADTTEYNALNSAIEAAEKNTLGFETGEYAPYNNVAAIKALAAAKAIDQTANNLKTTVKEATDSLTNATWKANTEEVNAVNNGTLKDVEVSTDASKTGAAMQALGWSANGTNYRQILGDVTSYPALSQTTDGRAVYTWGATFKYGETTGYTMPLKANTKYQITFKYCGWNGANNSFGVSVLDANNNGLATKTYSKASAGPQTAGAFISVKKVFTTGEAGDYVLSMIPSGNSTFADVVIVKAVPDEVTLDEAATAAPTASEYANVTLNRTFAAGWNSIVLPFATTATALGADEAAEYNGTEENKLKFSTVTDLKANTPYLVHFTAEQTAAKTFEGVTINPATEPKATGTDYDFVGTYTALAKDNTTIAEGDYITVKAGIQKAKGGNKLNAFRAYFKNNNPTATSEAKNMVLVIDDNTISTGINAVNAESVDDGNVYNVAGQKVSSSYKGLVIKNGKKYLRK